MKTSLNALASRFRNLRPQVGVDNAGRRLWADMVNATTGSGIIADSQIREFRQCCGWEAQFDRAPDLSARR